MTKTSKQQAVVSLDNYKPLMDERAELARSKKRIEERIRELDEALRPALLNRGEIIYGGFSFKVDAVPGRKSVDYKRMAEDYSINLDDYTKIGAPSSRFTIKPVNEL